MLTVNALDKRIIELLQNDGRQSSDRLGKKLGVSSATVRRRVRKLIANGVMQIQAVVDPEKVGLGLAAVVALDVAHEKLDSVMGMLANRPEVKWVSSCTGRFDMIAITRFNSTTELSEFVQKHLVRLQGVRNSETFVCLHVEKGRYTRLV